MKKTSLLLLSMHIALLSSCSELQHVVNNLPDVIAAPDGQLSNTYISNGLKEALDNGIDKEVSKLATKNGFFTNESVKILIPNELQKVDQTLRKIGLDKLADEGLKILNRAAEDAVGEAIPIFATAIKEMSIEDAKGLLLGGNSAATNYLKQKTSTALYQKFNPIIANSLDKVGANQIWKDIITKYNTIPLLNDAQNPDLTSYVTNESLKGVFKMIAIEEGNIRSKLSSRTSEVLRKVFALQD